MSLSTDFAFEGFRVIRQRPLLILYWGIAALVITGLAQIYLMPQYAPLLDQFTAATKATPQPDPAVLAPIISQLLPFYAIMMVLTLIFNAVINCAVYRAVNGEARFGLGYLRLGADEARQILVMIAFFFFILMAYIALVLVGSVLGGIIIAGLSALNPGLGAIGGALTFVAITSGLIWVMVRMSLYSVQTFEDKKFNLLGTWKLTKGQFWGLLAGYFIAFIMAMLVYLLLGLIYLGAAAVAGQNPMALLLAMTNAQNPMPTVELYSHPVMIGFMVLGCLVLTPLMTAIMAGAPAAAYKVLKASGPIEPKGV